MDIIATTHSGNDTLSRVVSLLPSMQQNAARLDDDAAFPLAEMNALRDAGVLAMPLPIESNLTGGEVRNGITDRLASVLVQVGCGNLAVGRLLEAHINARHLIARYGSSEQRADCAGALRNDALFAVWATDPPEHGLRMEATRDGIRLAGRKLFCSAAGHATCAVVTATNEHGAGQMLVVPLGHGERVEKLPAPLQGMRAAVTGRVDFSDCVLSGDARLGRPEDYVREPDFSAGAWRGSAVALGGLCGLLNLAVAQLKSSGRLTNPHQLQRLGEAMIASETSRLWLHQAARTAEDPDADPQRRVAYVGLGRIAIEAACLDAMRLVQRSLGLAAFRHGNAVERICRDLGTYLRQPAPDEVLTEAASYFAQQEIPEWP